MIKLLQKLFLFGVLITSASTLWCVEKQSGGQGHFDSSITNNCFKPNSGTVHEVCAHYRINWKMWSLMGEPVGDYNLAWDITSIQLMDPKRKLISNYSLDQLPDELKKSASKIELYIDGFANAQTSENIIAFHRFNTGTAVRTGAGSSLNVPGSPNWNKLFIKSGGTPCNTEQSNESWYLDSKKAKKIFTAGIKLSDLQICPSSSVSELTSLESAISTLCEKPGADKKYSFCPKQKAKEEETKKPPQEYTSNIWDELDDKTAEPEIRKKYQELVQSFRKSQMPKCEQKMKAIKQCISKAPCNAPKLPAGIDEEKCKNIPREPYYSGIGLRLTSGSCDDACKKKREENHKREDAERKADYNRRHNEWYSQYGDLYKKCEPLLNSSDNVKKCIGEYSLKCNPTNMSVDSCVENELKNLGPTYEDAKKLVREGWKKKATQPKPSPSQPTNFLD